MTLPRHLRRLRASIHEEEAGMTLIELVIYLSLSVLVSGLVVVLIVNTVIGQRTVTSLTGASTRGQALAESIERAVRDAAISVSSDAQGAQVLTIVTRPEDLCTRWRITTAGEFQLYQGTGTPDWGELATGVGPVGESDYFGWESGGRFRYGFQLATESRPVTFAGAVMPRGSTGAVGTTCS